MIPIRYRIYFIVKDDFSDAALFTVERGMTGGFLCGWNKEGDHINYHEMASPEWKENVGLMKAIEAKIIVDLYKGKGDSPR